MDLEESEKGEPPRLASLYAPVNSTWQGSNGHSPGVRQQELPSSASALSATSGSELSRTYPFSV